MILNDVTATISTRGRHNTTLPLVLSSILTQNCKPGKVVIYDDNDEFVDPRQNEIFNNILTAMLVMGVNWYWTPGARKGQIHNHEHARLNAETPFIWRIDDDNVLLPDTLEKMYQVITNNPKVGAVGPCIVDPKRPLATNLASNKIEDIYLGLNVQWNMYKEYNVQPVEHLQGSTFMYRVEAAKHGYDLTLSRKGHREETIFTYEMVRAGWQLAAINGLNTWHFHYSNGGIRSDHEQQILIEDEKKFQNKLAQWDVKPRGHKIIFLDSGRGDHYAFKSIIPDLLEKYKNAKIIMAVCWPDCFWDIKNDNIVICSLADALPIVNVEQHNIYMFMEKNNWKKSLTEAYKALYL